MRNRALMLATTAAIFGCGILAGNAQTPSAQMGAPQSPTLTTPGGSTTQQNEQVIRDVQPLEEEDDQDSSYGYRGMMGPG